MTVKDIIERIGQILIEHPGLLENNVQILNNFGIDHKLCKTGPGIDVLGYLNLEERLATIKEMGYDDEVLKNPSDALEIIRGYSMTLNYNEYKDMGAQYVKGAA